MQKKLASLRERVVANAVVQANDKPHEDPNALLRQAFGVATDLEKPFHTSTFASTPAATARST
jgi:hypothetical protein